MTISVNMPNGGSIMMSRDTFNALVNLCSDNETAFGSAAEWNILKTKKNGIQVQGHPVQITDTQSKKPQKTYPTQRQSKRAIYR